MKIEIAGILISAHDTSHNMPAIMITAGNKIHFMSLIFHLLKTKKQNKN